MRLFRPVYRGCPLSEDKTDAESRPSVASVGVCRICWDTGTEDDPLVAPCKCKGSMRYIHVSCLKQWQATQRADGHLTGAGVCGVCHTRYRTDFQPKRMLKEKQKHLLSHLKQISGQISDMAANDPWKLIQRAFEYGFLLNGLAQGGWCAGRGAGQAFRASMASQLPTMKSLASWLPEIILGSTLCKPLQVPILLSSTAFLAASIVEVAAYSAAGAYVGFLYGSTLGTLQMLRWSYASIVKLPVRTLTWACRGACRASGQLLSFHNSRGQAVSFLAQIALVQFLFKGR